MEAFGKPRHHRVDKEPAHTESKSTDDDRNNQGFAEAAAHFEPLERKFDALHEAPGPMRFSVGDRVKIPPTERSATAVDWEVVRAEKKHYLLERLAETGLVDHVFCSEDELSPHNIAGL
jgi:hypothetical protein